MGKTETAASDIFKPLSHKWKIERHYRPGLSHPTRIEKTCLACGANGYKSMMEKIAPCPGVPHDQACIKSFGHFMIGDGPTAHFFCQCGVNKDHEKKKFWKVHVCRDCDRPHEVRYFTKCLKSPIGWHHWHWRKI